MSLKKFLAIFKCFPLFYYDFSASEVYRCPVLLKSLGTIFLGLILLPPGSFGADIATSSNIYFPLLPDSQEDCISTSLSDRCDQWTINASDTFNIWEEAQSPSQALHSLLPLHGSQQDSRGWSCLPLGFWLRTMRSWALGPNPEWICKPQGMNSILVSHWKFGGCFLLQHNLSQPDHCLNWKATYTDIEVST